MKNKNGAITKKNIYEMNYAYKNLILTFYFYLFFFASKRRL